MKTVIVAMLLLVAVEVRAQSQIPTDQSLLSLAVDKVKEMRPVVLVSPYQRPAYVGYLPVWIFHAAYETDTAGKPIKDPYRQYVTLGGGWKYQTGAKDPNSNGPGFGQGFISGDLNLVALSARAWDFHWAQNHVDRSHFPPIYAGPALAAPMDYQGLKTLNLRRDLRAQFGVAYYTGILQTTSPNTP